VRVSFVGILKGFPTSPRDGFVVANYLSVVAVLSVLAAFVAGVLTIHVAHRPVIETIREP
jgi:hypothetical protein